MERNLSHSQTPSLVRYTDASAAAGYAHEASKSQRGDKVGAVQRQNGRRVTELTIWDGLIRQASK
jgi:hypothetical protein